MVEVFKVNMTCWKNWNPITNRYWHTCALGIVHTTGSEMNTVGTLLTSVLSTPLIAVTLYMRRGAVGSASDSWSVDTCQSWVRAPSKAPVVSLSKKLYSNCLVLVGSRNGFERDLHKQKMACFTIELKLISIN